MRFSAHQQAKKGATYTYTYDEAGNVTSVVGSDDSDDNHVSIKSEASYNYTTEDSTTYSVTIYNQDGKYVVETYDSKTGNLLSTTDTKGITTTYTYDAETDLVESVSKGNQSVEYTYDAFGKLIGISHEGTVYSFGYDKFGNRTTTAVGSRVLSTNTYDSNNGNLLSMSYGNGSEVAYTYDVFGNIAAMSYDGTEIVRNYTDSAGNINRTQDLLTNLEHRVTYDSTGRLISKEVLDLTATGDRWLRSLEYNYDLNNNVTYISYADKQGSNVTQYEYGLDNLPEKTILNNGKEVTYTYDTLGRLTGKALNTTNNINYTYTYETSDRGSGYTTTKIETETIGNTKYKYTYDDYGNITCIYKVNSDNTETLLCSYVYDNYNQLTTVNDYEHSEQTTYTYNQAGNITRRNRYQMNSSWVSTATLENVRYVYGDSEWKDLLTTYNGQTITYDAIGNPLSYRDGISLTWQKGRQLASYSDSNNNITYTYDASGMRTGKVVTTSSGATTNYSYVYENGLLQKMTRGSRILEFSYDASGNPVSIKYRSSASANPVYYYYGVNSRGDVIGLYNANGALSSTYEYDAYGKLLSVKTPAGIEITSETAIANLNPLRYRGYVYDNETDFYYLQTRYYDPTTCRFINEDIYYDTGLGFNGYNMFAYCSNNPTGFSDPSGDRYIASISVATESSAQRSASCQYQRFGRTYTIAYEVPVYDQGDTNICWAYCQAMIEDYNSRITRTLKEADNRAYEIAVEVNGESNWNTGNVPDNISFLYCGDILHLYEMLNEHGPLFAGYSYEDANGKKYGHAVVITGVDVYKKIVYTNNPWGIIGSQTYSKFLNGFIGDNSNVSWKLDGYNCLCGG